MKLQHKKTGELAEIGYIASSDGHIVLQDVNTEEFICKYGSLAELNEEWEDYEDGNRVYYITYTGDVCDILSEVIHPRISLKMKEIGNHFETKEEAEEAVEKLKAWKLLKYECNIKFDGIIRDDRAMPKGVKLKYDRHNVTFDRMRECMEALHLFFGDEE